MATSHSCKKRKVSQGEWMAIKSLDYFGIEQRAACIVSDALIELIWRNQSLEESRAQVIQHYEKYKPTFSAREQFWMQKIIDRALEMFDELIEHSALETSEITHEN